MVNADGVDTDPKKIVTLMECNRPNSVKDARSFLGLAGYYREHMPHYADLAAPLHELTKKGVVWDWAAEAEAAHQELIAALTSDTLLAYPRIDKGGWIVDTDASGRALALSSHRSKTDERK